MRESGTPASFYLEFWDANGKRRGIAQVTPASVAGWRQIRLQAKAPVGTTHVTVLVYCTQTARGVSYYDDVSLTSRSAYSSTMGKGRELFVDDYRIEQTVNVERRVHGADKDGEPLLLDGKPFAGYVYGTVLHIGEADYRMWYRCNAKMCHATSSDGLSWHKEEPVLKGAIDATVIHDTQEPNPARRFKLLTPLGGASGYGVYFSRDGREWSPSKLNPVLPYGDVANVAYDASSRRYIATTKQRMLLSGTPGMEDRAAFVSTSADFEHWSTPHLAVEGDGTDDAQTIAHGGLEAQIYGMPVVPYGAGYLAFPWVYEIHNYTNGPYGPTAGDGPVEVQIAYSRDLIRWSRPNRTPVLPRGLAGSWDAGGIYTASNLITTDTQMIMYYAGSNTTHGGGPHEAIHVGRATWRRDGMVSLANGGDKSGTITTKPIKLTGGNLYVNAKLKNRGSLKIEILDTAGHPINGFTYESSTSIAGDQLESAASWADGDISSLSGREVKLRFHLTKGDLYSYWVE